MRTPAYKSGEDSGSARFSFELLILFKQKGRTGFDPQSDPQIRIRGSLTKVFLSSVISGLEAFREAADEALTTLDHQVIRAEQFAASPKSPQIACLAGVRDADFMVLVLNERYGEPSPSISPTHQEFLEARDNGKPLFVFVQSNITPDDQQRALIREAQGWVSGAFTAGFASPAELAKAITRAVNRWQLSEAVGVVDVGEMVERATAQIPQSDRNGYSGDGPALWISLVGGPPRQILRPSEIEQAALGTALMEICLTDNMRSLIQAPALNANSSITASGYSKMIDPSFCPKTSQSSCRYH